MQLLSRRHIPELFDDNCQVPFRDFPFGSASFGKGLRKRRVLKKGREKKMGKLRVSKIQQ